MGSCCRHECRPWRRPPRWTCRPGLGDVNRPPDRVWLTGLSPVLFGVRAGRLEPFRRPHRARRRRHQRSVQLRPALRRPTAPGWPRDAQRDGSNSIGLQGHRPIRRAAGRRGCPWLAGARGARGCWFSIAGTRVRGLSPELATRLGCGGLRRPLGIEGQHQLPRTCEEPRLRSSHATPSPPSEGGSPRVRTAPPTPGPSRSTPKPQPDVTDIVAGGPLGHRGPAPDGLSMIQHAARAW